MDSGEPWQRRIPGGPRSPGKTLAMTDLPDSDHLTLGKTLAMTDRADRNTGLATDRAGEATTADLLAAIRRAARQEQFLEVVSAPGPRGRFPRHVPHTPLPAETVSLGTALGRVLAHDVSAPIDVPP